MAPVPFTELFKKKKKGRLLALLFVCLCLFLNLSFLRRQITSSDI